MEDLFKENNGRITGKGNGGSMKYSILQMRDVVYHNSLCFLISNCRITLTLTLESSWWGGKEYQILFLRLFDIILHFYPILLLVLSIVCPVFI